MMTAGTEARPAAVSGFVLVGGKSSRMGRDKALLPWNGTTLAQYTAGIVAQAAGSAAFIGDPERYAGLGYPVFADLQAGYGPLGGIVTALTLSAADWSLVTGCDMPGISSGLLRRLIDAAAAPDCGCVVPIGPGGPEPLCAIYHRACLEELQKAIAARRLKMREVVRQLRVRFLTGIDASCFANLNTPGDFEALSRS